MSRAWIGLLVAATIATHAAAPALVAQDGPSPLPRLSAPVRFDGGVDDAEWGSIAPLPLTMYTPIHRGEATERTEIRLAYDDEYLWASGRLFDSAPEGIRVNSLFRDRWSGDDTFVLFVDSFNDNRTARRFAITPAGTRMDELIGDDGLSRNADWNAPWEVRTTRDANGWYFEMRVPFSSLRFQERAEGVVMGFTVSRYIARKNERLNFPDIDPRFRFDQPSRTQDFLLTGIRPTQPTYVTPYVVGGRSRAGGATTATPASTAANADAGLDVKFTLNDRSFVDLSLNTDFAQVEADDQQVNLSRFPLFYPEKRQFFQERSDLFQLSMGNGGQLFHSRTIGLSDDRTPVRILGGARFVGRVGEWDLGALDMQSGADGATPGENFGVVRATRRIGNQHSRVGGLLTSRATNRGALDLTGGLDASYRVAGDHYAEARLGVTDNAGDRAGASIGDRSQYYLAWERRVDRGLTYWARHLRAGPDFDPSLGFLPRRDFNHTSLYAVYGTTGAAGDRLRGFGPGVIVNRYHTNGTGALQSEYIGHWWNLNFWDGAYAFAQVTRRREVVTTAFPLGDGVGIPAGAHQFTDLWLFYAAGPTRPIRPTVQARYGQFYDGRQLELQLNSIWNLSRHLELSGGYSLNAIRFDDRDARLDVHALRVQARIAANTRLQATALTQYNSVADRLGINLRVRYNFSEGTDLWLVYDEGFNTDRLLAGSPDRLPLSARRELAVKLSYTFVR